MGCVNLDTEISLMRPSFGTSSFLAAFVFPVLLVQPRPAWADAVYVDDCFTQEVGESCGFGQGTCRQICVDAGAPPPDVQDVQNEAQSQQPRCSFQCRDGNGQQVEVNQYPDDGSCWPRCEVVADDCYGDDAGASCGFGQGTCWEICEEAGPPPTVPQDAAPSRPQQCNFECLDANGMPVDVQRYPDDSSCAVQCALGRRGRAATGVVTSALLGFALVLFRWRRRL
jgi:hypothetical protein